MDKTNLLNERLRQIILKKTRETGVYETPVQDFFLVRRNESDVCLHSFERPLIGLVIRGEKHSSIGGQDFIYNDNQTMIAGIDLPVSSYVVNADKDNPFLFLMAYLDKRILADLCMEMNLAESGTKDLDSSVSIHNANEDILEIFDRLLDVCDKPEQAKIRGKMLMRELHYLLLLGPHQDFLRSLYMPGKNSNNIVEVISWLRANYKMPMQIEHLARICGMSLTSLHRHFKTLTGLSPLQYQKQLRLYEAQKIMLVDNEPASYAAYEVGYESVTQFNREYKKFFGEPPFRDIQKRRMILNPGG